MKKIILLALMAVSCTTGYSSAAEPSEASYEDMYGAGEAVQLTLSDSIGMALMGDERIGSAEAGRDAAKWGLSAARRSKGPTVAWNSRAVKIGGRDYQSNRESHSTYGNPHTAVSVAGYVFGELPVYTRRQVGSYAYNNTFSNSWNLTVPIYSGGQLEGQIDANRYKLNRADLTLENTRQTVRYDVASAYAELVHRENLERVAKESVDMPTSQLRLINDQYVEGAVAKADVLTIEVRLANYKQNLMNAKGAANVAKSRLASAVGLPQDTNIKALDVFSYEPYPRKLEECEEYAIVNRPDGFVADYDVKIAEAQKDAAKSGYRPKITGTASQSIGSNSPFRSERNNQWEAGVNISWNIFDNGITSAGVNQAKALIEQYKEEAERVKKNIRLETRSAYIQMRTAEANIQDAAIAVKKAEENYMIAQVRYEEGVDILLNLTDAQERLTQARSNYYTALYQYNLYRAALEKAMGVPVGFDVPSYVEAEHDGMSANKAVETAALPAYQTEPELVLTKEEVKKDEAMLNKPAVSAEAAAREMAEGRQAENVK
ncbi:MAG: TolC family protein [Selenomonadaceae bacterium]|nr:TolC family protein [Selenomonadaceae bacterium]